MNFVSQEYYNIITYEIQDNEIVRTFSFTISVI